MNDIVIFSLGILSQVLFFSRNIAQWFLSEKKGEVISPAIYWQISLAASIFMLIYGILRFDFAIILGQFIVYFIYIRNLQLKKAWTRINIISRILAISIPLLIFVWLTFGKTYNFTSFIKNDKVPLLLMLWGSAGQIIFTFRFIYQWIYSEKRKDSFLPVGFWVISIIGSLMIFTYSIYRLDPVLFAAHGLGLFIYIRNILLHKGKSSLYSKLNNNPAFQKCVSKIMNRIN
jgi:lipid-A-disaccharide synthase-like uncharacterized protein